MTAKTIDCIDCGEPVPYGRLSCPACGALLASVAGALRSPVRHVVDAETGPAHVAVEPAAEVGSPDEAEPELDAREIPAPSPTVEPDRDETVEPGSPVELDPAVELASVNNAAVEPAEPGPDEDVEPEPVAFAEPVEDVESEPVAFAEPGEPAEPEPVGELAEPAGPADVAAAVAMPQPSASVLGATEPPRWPPLDEPEAIPVPGPYRVQAASVPDGPATSAAAYRPPAFALATATTAGRRWPGFGGSSHLDSTVPTAEATADDTTETEAGSAARFVEFAGWFVVIGAALSALGFLLPWSRVVIGAAHIGGYFDSWGLASPTHLIVLAGLLVVLALGIIRTAVPAWLRTGVLGLAAGGILIGLAWPYVVGPLGSDVGVTVIVLGGVALGIGGVVGSWATRHAVVGPVRLSAWCRQRR